MAKITVTLTAVYDDGKSVKGPGDTISVDDKLAKQLASLGMVALPVKESKVKGKSQKAEDSPPPDDGLDPPIDLDGNDEDL